MTSKEHRDLANLLASQLVPMASSIILTYATASWLGPAGRGEFSFLTASSNLLGQALSLSLYVGASNAFLKANVGNMRRSIKLAGSLSLLVALIGTPIFWLASPHSSWGPAIAIIPFLASLVLVHLVISRTLQGIGLSGAFRRVSIVGAITSLGLGAPLAMLTASPLAVLGAWAASLLLSTVLSLSALRPALLSERASDPSRYETLFREAIPIHVGIMGQQILFRADLVVLGFFVPAASLGVYSVASPIVNLVFVVAEVGSLATFGYANAVRTVESQELRRASITRRYFLAAPMLGFSLLLGAHFLFTYLLEEYSDAWLLVLLMLPGVIVQGYARIGLSSMTALSDRRTSLKVGLFSGALSLLYVPFIILGGIIGAAISTSLIYVLQSIYVRRQIMLRSGD